MSVGRTPRPIKPIVEPELPEEFVLAEEPALALQVAPCFADIVALVPGLGVSADDLEATVTDELKRAAAELGAAPQVVSLCLGDPPSDPDVLDELEVVANNRRQTFGLFLGSADAETQLPREQGTRRVDLVSADQIDTSVDPPTMPYGLSLRIATLEEIARQRLSDEGERYSFAGEACECGPIRLTGVSIARVGEDTYRTSATGELIALPERARPEFEITVTERLSIFDLDRVFDVLLHGPVAEIEFPGRARSRPEVDFHITKPGFADDPIKLNEMLLAMISPGDMLRLVGGALVGGVEALIEKQIPPELIPAPFALLLAGLPRQILLEGTVGQDSPTGKKVVFDARVIDDTDEQLVITGDVLVRDRRPTVRIRDRDGRGTPGNGVALLRFQAFTADLRGDVTYNWESPDMVLVGEDDTDEVTFRLEGGAETVRVSVTAADQDGASDSEELTFHIARIGALVKVTAIT